MDKDNNKQYSVTGGRYDYDTSRFSTYAEAEADAKERAADNYKTYHIWKQVAVVQNKLPIDIQVTKH